MLYFLRKDRDYSSPKLSILFRPKLYLLGFLSVLFFFIPQGVRAANYSKCQDLVRDFQTIPDTITINRDSTLVADANPSNNDATEGNFRVIDCSTYNLIVSNNATIQIQNAWNTNADYNDDFGLLVRAKNITISSGVTLNADGRGYPQSVGPGRGLSGGRRQPGSGAGYGGSGIKLLVDSNPAGSAAYGSSFTPRYLGSGGGGCWSNGSGGGLGGGALKFQAKETLLVDGTVSANGLPGVSGDYACGGGAGGMLFLEAPVVTGDGILKANGGAGGNGVNAGGSGGGGRIIVRYTTGAAPAGLLDAQVNGGSNAKNQGQAGTAAFFNTNTQDLTLVSGFEFRYEDATADSNGNGKNEYLFRNLTAQNVQDLRVEAAGPYDGREIVLSGNFDITQTTLTLNRHLQAVIVRGDIRIRSGSVIQGVSGGSVSMLWQSEGGFTLENNARMDLSGAGEPTQPVLACNKQGAGGGGHGGNGGGASAQPSGFLKHGFAFDPQDIGSGGGQPSCGGTGGAGGGAISVITDGDITIDSTVRTNGVDGTGGGTNSNASAAGGGAGGSIRLRTQGQIKGTGSLAANGGSGGVAANPNTQKGGGGAGGRILVEFANGSIPQALKNAEATAGKYGAPAPEHGTVVFRKKNTSTPDDISVFTTFEFQDIEAQDNAYTFQNVIFDGATFVRIEGAGNAKTLQASNLTINNAILQLDNSITWDVQNDALVSGTSLIQGAIGIQIRTVFDVSGNFTLGPDASIRLDGAGFPALQGPGKGQENGCQQQTGGGGSYGGTGGLGTGGTQGATYGDSNNPQDFGSGGGEGCGSTGGAGGGSIEINVAKNTQLSGVISANGNPGNGDGSEDGGGGAGGSIKIDTRSAWSGSGARIQTNGGTGSNTYTFNDPTSGAGGGGGRIFLCGTNMKSAQDLANLNGTVEAAGGVGGSGVEPRHNGSEGTIVWCTQVGIGAGNIGPEGNLLEWGWIGSCIADIASPICNLSGSLGWVSGSCRKLEDGGTIDETACAQVPYGVAADFDTGQVTGYAWFGTQDSNRNAIGWIEFDPSGPYPAEPNNGVRFNKDNLAEPFTGWARIKSIYESGLPAYNDWGWIKMSGIRNLDDPNDDYGVTLERVNIGGEDVALLNGYGWSGGDSGLPGTGLGWVSFQHAVNIIPAYLQTVGGDIFAGGNIGSANPSPEPNATYLILANGNITNFTSAQAGPEYVKENAVLPGMNLPNPANQYANVLGKIDKQKITTIVDGAKNVYGDIVNTFAMQDPLFLDGSVWTVQGDQTLNSFTIRNGTNPSEDASGFIIVNGNLTINGGIVYDNIGDNVGITHTQNLASVAWLVEGNLTIGPDVENLVGAFIVMGDVIVSESEKSLTVRGLMMAQGYQFRRTFTGTPGDPQPSEQIFYDGRLLANTPPGLTDFALALPKIKRLAR